MLLSLIRLFTSFLSLLPAYRERNSTQKGLVTAQLIPIPLLDALAII